jgi:hypothetical protein
MSWSFSVNEENRENALAAFDTRCQEQIAFKNLPEDVSDRLKQMARTASEGTPEDAFVILSSNGHSNGDGHWWGAVNVNFCALKPKPEEAEEDLRDHDPKPGDPEYAEAIAEERVIDGGSPSATQ